MAQKNLLEIDRADLIDSLVINHILKEEKKKTKQCTKKIITRFR